MQRKSSARQKAVTDVQRGPAGQALARAPLAIEVTKVPPPSSHGSGETTLGGHVDRGLTLAALYDIGVLGRLRLDVRLRLLADLTQSLAWLHANPRLMAAYPHLAIAPSTIVIGLDGVARVDVRAAKKQGPERNPAEADYLAPEVARGDPSADHRADIFSLGVLGWEAIVGARLGTDDWATGTRLAELCLSDVPAALGGPEREPLRRRAPTRPAPKVSGTRCRVPGLTLPEGGEWAESVAAILLRGMSPEVGERPQDCRELLRELESIAGHLASTQEIAEVVQGISAVDTLCVPQPTLPMPEAACQTALDQLGFLDRQACDTAADSCARARSVAPRRRVAPALPARAEPAPAARLPEGPPPKPTTASKLRDLSSGSSGPAWFAAGLLWLALLGVLAGYAASLFRG